MNFAFRMYKAPSWQIIADAGLGLPNAIVAMERAMNPRCWWSDTKRRTARWSPQRRVAKKLSEVYDNLPADFAAQDCT